MLWPSHLVDIIVPATKTTGAATVADHIDSTPYFAPLADDLYHTVVAAKAVTLALHVHKPVFVKSTGLGRRAIELIDGSANLAHRHVARGMADVISNNVFHILPTNLSSNPVHS